MDERRRLSTDARTARLVPAAAARGLLQLVRARVAEKVVARDDVVHAQALGAGEALADVALQQVPVVDDVLAATVLEPCRRDGFLARLAADGRFHGRWKKASGRGCGGTNRGTIAQVPHGAVRGRRSTPFPHWRVPERYNVRPLGTDGATTRADGATPMNRTLAALLAVGLLAGPAVAQSKLDQAIAKAEDQVAKGKPDEAIKTLTKAAAEAGPEGQVALARLQERVGNLDAAAAAYDQAKSAGASNPDVLAAVANFTLRHGKAQDALAIAKQAVAAGATPGRARRDGPRAGAHGGRPGRPRHRGQGGRRGRDELRRPHGARRGPLRDGQERRRGSGGAQGDRARPEVGPRLLAARPRPARARQAGRRGGRGQEGNRARRQVRRGLRHARRLDPRQRPEGVERGDRAGPAGRLPRPRQPDRPAVRSARSSRRTASSSRRPAPTARRSPPTRRSARRASRSSRPSSTAATATRRSPRRRSSSTRARATPT